ncbi:MAG: phosphate ABC transporter substrate-binding protein [Chloroflexi bacterium]|nr:phosphate ABC transporter substrate-binding protein [Chloroflexota bacterium]
MSVSRCRSLTWALLLAASLLAGCQRTSGAGEEANAAGTTIQDQGSDTLVNLALAWAEAYHQEYPDVTVSVTGGGSGAGLAALVNGTTDIANASRPIKPEEIEQARAKGFTPQELVVARDAIAVLVNPGNPVDELTLVQVADIFSGRISNWREVGGEDRPIVRLSRETNSGTHVYFLEHVLRRGENGNETLFSTDTLLLPSSEGISAEIRQNPNAIGYDGLGYVTPDLKVVAVAEAGMPFILPSIQTVNDGTYPIARDLYMYTAGEPDGVLADYLRWILGPEAQALVASLGFVPVEP